MIITFGEILDVGITRLRQAGIADAEIDAQSLLLYLMHENRNFIYLHKHDGTDEYHANAYFELIDRRAEGEPLQYIVGEQEFMGLPFEVTPAALIPRQDTETLVEMALGFAKDKKPGLSILDMCCGSGAIAVSAAHFLPKSKIKACDLSEEAIALARSNAEKNGVSKQISFVQTDLFEVIGKRKKTQMRDRFDMILCNPPYIPSEIIPTLQTEIRDHEPLMALDGGNDGLDFYRRIAPAAADRLKKDGILLLEIGYDQAESVTALLKETERYVDIFPHKDLAKLDRVISCKLRPKK